MRNTGGYFHVKVSADALFPFHRVVVKNQLGIGVKLCRTMSFGHGNTVIPVCSAVTVKIIKNRIDIIGTFQGIGTIEAKLYGRRRRLGKSIICFCPGNKNAVVTVAGIIKQAGTSGRMLPGHINEQTVVCAAVCIERRAILIFKLDFYYGRPVSGIVLRILKHRLITGFVSVFRAVYQFQMNLRYGMLFLYEFFFSGTPG